MRIISEFENLFSFYPLNKINRILILVEYNLYLGVHPAY